MLMVVELKRLYEVFFFKGGKEIMKFYWVFLINLLKIIFLMICEYFRYYCVLFLFEL